MTRRAAYALAALTVGAVLVATLLPQPGQAEEIAFCLRCDERGIADAIANLILFLPVGGALALAFGLRRAAWLALLLSLSVEALQLWVPGRHTALADLVFNSAGGVLGALLVPIAPRLLRPSRAAALALAASWAIGAATVLAGGSALFAADATRADYFGQWTPRLGTFGVYHGRVLDARIGALEIPSWRLPSSAAARAGLAAGEELHVRVEARPHAGLIAPIFAIADREERQILMIAADGSDLIFRHRTRATALGFDSPDVRVFDAFAGIGSVDTIDIRVAPAAGGRRARVAVDERSEELRLTPLDTWSLLLWPTFVARSPMLHATVNAGWLVFLTAPVAWWLGAAARARRPGAR